MDNQPNKLEPIMRQLESSNPSICLHKKEIERRFCKLSHTPDHPPYASMIQRAISELNDQGGSSEEAISKFIETRYDDLPIAHASYLSHHLQKLLAKGEIVYTSANSYLPLCEYSDSVHKSKGQKQSRKGRQGRLKGRLRAVKGVQSQQKQPIEEGQEHNEVCEKISEGAEEQKQSEEQRIGLIGENIELGDAVLMIGETIELNEEKEALIKTIEDEACKEAEEINSQEQCQVLCKTINGTAEKQNEEEESHQVRTSGEVAEKVVQEVREDVVIEEALLREQRTEIPVESNLIGELKSVADIQIGTMEEQQGQCFELSCEDKKLQELSMEVRHHIKDLSNLLEHFDKKKREDEATASTQHDAKLEDHFGSSHLTEKESIQLLIKACKIAVKLSDIVEHNNLKPKTGMKQKNSLENHPQQTKETCLQGSESLLVHGCQPQQHEICGQPDVSESQPKAISASDSVPCSLMGFEQSCQIELSTRKRPPEVEITVLERLNRDQNKLVKLCDQQKAFALQPKSLHDKNENSQGVVESIKMVVPESQLVTSSMELQAVDLGKQAELQKTNALPTEINLSITDTSLLQHPYLTVPEISAEQGTSVAYVNINSEQTAHEHQADPTLSLDIQFSISRRPPEQVEELSTDHQQEITLSDAAMPPGFELGQEQQPEDQVEGRPTEHKLTQQQMQGEKLQEQLPPLSQMLLSEAEVPRATYIAKQCVRRKKMPDQQQLKKLRPRGPRPSKHESVLTTVEADNDFTTLASLKAKLKQNSKASINRRLEMQGSQTEVEISGATEQAPLNGERQQKHGHKAVVKVSQPAAWQVNHGGQVKQLKSKPTRATVVDSASSSHQQTQEQPHSQSESVVAKSTEELLPLGNLQTEQVKQQRQGRGRPPKVKPNVEPRKEELSVLNHQHHVQKQSPCRARGRPPKKKTNEDASMKKSLVFNHQDHEEQPGKHAQGRPSEKKTDADASMEASKFLDHRKREEEQQKQAPGRAYKRKRKADASVEGSGKRGRGRPPKLKHQ